MSDNTAPARKHCSLQEALEAVGKSAFPSEWTGHEANLSPAKDFATLRRHVRSTRALLALLHDGRVTAWFIFDGSTLEEQRREIIPSAWPNPAKFLARMPFGDLWFNLVSSRGVLRPKPEDSPAWYQRFANTPLWHAYSPLTGRIELDHEALRLAIGDGIGQASAVDQEPEEADAPSPSPPPARRRGRRPQYDWALFHAEIARKVGKDPDGFPVIQADLEHIMTDWCVTTWGENKCPSESTIRSQVSKHYNDDSQGR